MGLEAREVAIARHPRAAFPDRERGMLRVRDQFASGIGRPAEPEQFLQVPR